MHKSIISPSVMCFNMWKDGERVLKELEDIGTELLHADVMDGHFVNNFMLGTDAIKNLRKSTNIPLDIHLMIERPEDKLPWFDIQENEYVSIHYESTNHLEKALSFIREKGAHPMVAINPATPISVIEEVLPIVDAVLIMTVNPGFAGQKMVPFTLSKIRKLRKYLDENKLSHVRIEVDGNVSFENGIKMREAGADIFVLGTSSLFTKDGSIKENGEKFRNCVE
ncbi:MAG: ribulose-phosphate 3-epimerase [Clostridia bacterium]|nr:ribulose-phosphate 3-epimerase [Clostridia bacterium]